MTTPLRTWHKRALQANLVAQAGIVVTGAIVRLTASGLGCPTWPECVEGSITPTSTQTEAWHKYIEFGNRMLTTVLVVVAIACIAAMRQHNMDRVAAGLTRRTLLLKLALACFGGIFAQAILGGITVLTGLNPLTVAAHFLVSIGLIAVAAILLWRAQESTDSRELTISPIAHRGIQTLVGLALIVIVIGTLVTGTGPHAGDTAEITRLPFDPRVISWIHADVVLLFMGLLIGLLVTLHALNASHSVKRAGLVTLVVALGQGTIGYVQYFTSLPWALVAFHVAGACLLWIATLRFLLSTKSATETQSVRLEVQTAL
jgi:cytochrome c oxidase assembly protein subunit 15